MQSMTRQTQTDTNAKQTVLSFIEALNDANFDGAREYLDDGLVFQGVLGSKNGADEYMKDMKKMRFKYAVQKVFEEGNDVCLWYDINMSGTEILSSGWYKVKNGKIISFKVIFDPRPLLDQAKK